MNEKNQVEGVWSPPHTVNDWLFAFVNANTPSAKEVMLSHLTEEIGEMVAELDRLRSAHKV